MSKVSKPEADGFASFWNLWKEHQRKSDGRGKARPAYQQMIDAGYDPQDIIDGANWYLRNMDPRDAPYIPLASSWLRSERFADDCEKERAFQAAREQRAANVVSIQPAKKPAFLEQWERQRAGGAA